ncbi:hypothetical protein [Streptomyces griseorubiginosus]|uniref:hypothetical protein n=1 Tax=Streptomyces griseorubiginosus TaxID=67304 RepID=UPI00331BA23A
MIETRTFTDTLITMLAQATGKPVGEGRRPDGNPSHYYLVRFITRTDDGAPYTDDNEDAVLTYQIDSVSGPDPETPDSYGTQGQVQWMDDKARNAILARNPATRAWLHDLPLPDGKVIGRRSAGGAGEEPDASDAIMSSAQRFAFTATST